MPAFRLKHNGRKFRQFQTASDICLAQVRRDILRNVFGQTIQCVVLWSHGPDDFPEGSGVLLATAAPAFAADEPKTKADCDKAKGKWDDKTSKCTVKK